MIQLFAVVLPVLILFCGLSVDIGMLELKKIQMQTAADAAALGGELEAERGTNNWVNIATAEAGINGFTNGSNNTTVSVVEGATSGAYNGRYDAIQATITQSVHTVFMGALHGGTFTLTAQSSALMTPCIYTLGTTLQNYSLIVATGSLLGISCPIYATSEQVQAYGQIEAEAVDVSGSASSSSNVGIKTYPSPVYNVPTITDPLSSYASVATQPSFSSCGSHSSTTNITTTTTLSPGTYCKGLNITNATVTLNPGLYIITGGANWNGATVSGTGVTLFFTTGGGGGYGQFIIQNSSTVTMSAANDDSNGAIPAILVWADKTWTHTNAQDFQLIQSTIYGDGIWYTPAAGIKVQNIDTSYSTTNNIYTAPNYMGFVADNMYLTGTQIAPVNNYSYVTTGNPFRAKGTLIQ
jgi:Flp pilus assembly protein TadG